MLIIDDNTVYEIDEECVRKNKVTRECNLPIDKMQKERKNVLLVDQREGRSDYNNVR
ncbi:MAG: hypothetical protein ACI4ES_11255 [Roseburia sp.]